MKKLGAVVFGRLLPFCSMGHAVGAGAPSEGRIVEGLKEVFGAKR